MMDAVSRLSQNVRVVLGQLSTRYLYRGAATRVMATRSYSDAVEHLNSLQTNAATLEAVRASGGKLSDLAIPEMLEYLGRIGYTVCSHLDIVQRNTDSMRYSLRTSTN